MLTQTPSATLILIVEDDENHAELIQRSFEDAQDEYRLEFAANLSDARHALELRTPDLILTDYRLPDGDGKELVGIVEKACPVILMTSQGNEQLAVDAMKAGAQDYIVKSPETFGSLTRIVGLALREWRIVRERREIYEAVSRGKREWEQTFDSVPDLISIIDTQHTISRVNRSMADRCGLKPQELIGRKCYEVVHGLTKPPPFCAHVRMMQDGLEHAEELEEKCLNGFFHVTVSPLHDSDGRIKSCVHVARDISDRKKDEEERLKMQQQFQQTQKLESLGVLAGGIAHDFNNILTIILGHCYIVKEDIDSGMTDKTHVQQIENAANRAADLCRQMLAYSGNSPRFNEKINLWLLIDEIVKMLQSAIKKNVTIQLDLKRDVPGISGDNAQLQQVVMNLIINAAEAIGDKNGTIRVDLRKIIEKPGVANADFMGNAIPAGQYACLEVSDNGCGMDDDTCKRIFEPFFTTKFTGRGLGLSAVLGIIKSHGGAMQLTSIPGVGTSFRVYLPLLDSTDVSEPVQTFEPAPVARASGTVLLVDDEEVLRTIGLELLKSAGYSVMVASNGREALDIFSEQSSGIDLILLDLIMPVMGGLEAYHGLRAMDAAVPIILCSGHGVDGVMKNIVADKNVYGIQKPYKPGQLQSMIFDLLDKTE